MNSQEGNSYHFRDEQTLFCKISSSGVGRSKGIQPAPEEVPTPDVKDKSLVDSLGCDPHLFTYDELHTLFIHMLDKLGLVEHFGIQNDTQHLLTFSTSLVRISSTS